MKSRQWIALGLLAFVPLAAAAEHLGWGQNSVFFFSAVAIVPLAVWLSTATEELSIALGPAVGSLLNALFGNATELIIALAALRAGLGEIVKASITGTVMANLLLALGLSMLIGGLGRREQVFQPVVARVNGSAMTLAVLAILIPSLSSLAPGASSAGNEAFSIFVAWLLLLVYALTLLFSLRTHRSLYEVAEVERQPDEATPTPHRPATLPWLLVLLGATVGLAYVSELFVGVIESVTASFGFTPLFTGIVLLPLLGGVAEYITAVSMARRNQMDLAVSVALGSTLLMAVLVAPLLVLLGPVLGQPLDLSFNPFELVAIATAVLVSNLVSLDGRSDWLEGVLLLTAYVILAAGFYFQTGPVG
ncbi:MAG: calcium/proton exchanger [Cyanobacteriota bacterium]